MRRNKIILLSVFCLLSLAFGLLSLTGCGHHEKAAAGSHKVLYHCPMHPSYTSDKPGDCPICGMKLVRVENAEKPAVAVSAGQSVTPADEKSLEEVCVEHKCTMKGCVMDVKAHIKPGERIICPVCGEVISTTSGKVVEIVKQPPVQEQGSVSTTPGKARKLLYYRNPMNPEATSLVPMKDSMGMDYVPVYEEPSAGTSGPTIMISPEKQQLIGVKTEAVQKRALDKVISASGKIAYDPELAVTQEEFIQALTNEDNVKDSPLKDVVDRAKSMTDAARNKLKLLGMNDNEIVELQKTRTAQTNLYLPKSGESVWAYIDIYEYEIGAVKIGDKVEIEAISYPGETFTGIIKSINPVLNPVTRTNQVRVEIENKDNKLKPEMFVNAKIRVVLGEKLAVPESAVLDTGLRKIVYLSKPDGVLESREVELGQKAEGYYEVLSGLTEGDVVVTSGNFLVDSESKLKSR